MPEIKTPPIRTKAGDGGDIITFTDDHTLGDIVRWIMENPGDAETVHMMLGEQLNQDEWREIESAPLDGTEFWAFMRAGRMMFSLNHFLSWLYTHRIWGSRCPDFDWDCHTCKAWETHDQIFNDDHPAN